MPIRITSRIYTGMLPAPIYPKFADTSGGRFRFRDPLIKVTREWIMIYSLFAYAGEFEKFIDICRGYPHVKNLVECTRQFSVFLFGDDRIPISQSISIPVDWSIQTIESESDLMDATIVALSNAAQTTVLLYNGRSSSISKYRISNRERIRRAADVMEILTLFSKIWGGVKFHPRGSSLTILV